jgi:hypothetical protein
MSKVLKDMQGKVLKVGDKVALVGERNGRSLTIGVIKELFVTRAAVQYKGLWGSALDGKAVDMVNTKALVRV